MTALFTATLVLYFLASVAYHAHLFAGMERARTAAPMLVGVGLAVHLGAIGSWCLAQPGPMFRDPAMLASLAAFFIALVQLLADFRFRWTSLGSLSLPLAFVAQFYASIHTPGTGSQAPPSPMLSPHVLALLLGFAALSLAFGLAVLYLVQARLLKKKQIRGFFKRLPPLESLGTGAHWLATAGFSMLTLGIVTGAIAAPQHWGPGWYLDPRTLSSVIAWAIYAAYMAASGPLGWRGRRTTYFLIAGYLVVVLAFAASVSRPKAIAAFVPAEAAPRVARQ
jgi:ABC-type uncharacterized transport system permease subunit